MKNMLSLLIVFLFNFAICFAVVYFIGFIISKKRKSLKPIRISTILVIALIFSAIGTYPSLNDIKVENEGESIVNQNSVNSMTPEDIQKVQEIIRKVVQEPGYLTTEIHNEFWSIINKYGNVSKENIEQIRDLVTGISNKYMKYFYQDALISMQRGNPYKSAEREAYEKHLIELGLNEAKFKENDEMMNKIAIKEAVNIQGSSIVLTEDMINEIIANINSISERLDKLFTK